MMTLAVVLIGGVLAFIFCCTAVNKQRKAANDFAEHAVVAVDVLETSLSAILQRDERLAVRSRLVPLLKDPDFRSATVVDRTASWSPS